MDLYTTLTQAAAGHALITILAGAWGLWLATWLARRFSGWMADRINAHFGL